MIYLLNYTECQLSSRIFFFCMLNVCILFVDFLVQSPLWNTFVWFLFAMYTWCNHLFVHFICFPFSRYVQLDFNLDKTKTKTKIGNVTKNSFQCSQDGNIINWWFFSIFSILLKNRKCSPKSMEHSFCYKEIDV